MSSISNKTVRIIICWVLLIVACVAMIFIPQKSVQTEAAPPPAKPELKLSDADQVCIKGALYESWMYVFTDKQFIADTAKILDNLEYEKSKDAVNMMDAHKVYCLTFSKGNKHIKKFIVDDNNMLCFSEGTQSYKITSDFDFEELSKLVQEEIAQLQEK